MRLINYNKILTNSLTYVERPYDSKSSRFTLIIRVANSYIYSIYTNIVKTTNTGII